MQKQAPTVGRILVMAIFTLSCFGLLLYLWSAFGGPVPLKPHGYRFHASFAEATQLAQEADVRISGVNVGKVKKIELGDDGRTDATIELQDQYAPMPAGQPGDPAPEDAARRDLRRADARHQERAEDPRGRPARDRPASRRPSSWTRSSARSTRRRARASRSGSRTSARASRATAQDFSDALGGLPAVRGEHERGAEDPELAGARDAARRSRTPAWCSTRSPSADGQLADWIANSNAPAEHDRPARRPASARSVRAFPTFIDESQLTLRDARGLRREHQAAAARSCTGRHAAQPNVLVQRRASLSPDFDAVLHRAQPAAPGVGQGPAGLVAVPRPTRATCSSSSTRSCATSTRSSSTSAMYRREIAALFANDTAVTAGHRPDRRGPRALPAPHRAR